MPIVLIPRQSVLACTVFVFVGKSRSTFQAQDHDRPACLLGLLNGLKIG
jgi:hypothetical protein